MIEHMGISEPAVLAEWSKLLSNASKALRSHVQIPLGAWYLNGPTAISRIQLSQMFNSCASIFKEQTS